MVDRHLRRYDIAERVFAVSGAAGGVQGDLALVRRGAGRLDHLHVVLPDAAVRRLSVRTPLAALVGAATSGRRPLGFGRRGVGHAAGRTGRRLEAELRRESHLADTAVVVGDGGDSLFRPIGDQSVGSGVVQRRMSRAVALPSLCPLQRRIAGRAVELSLLFRADVRFIDSVVDVVGGVRSLRGPLRGIACLRVAIAHCRR